MKVLFFKSVLVLGIAGICLDSSAQNKPKPKPKTTTNAPQRKSTAPATDPFGNPIGGGTTTPNKPPATVKPKPGATNGGAAADPFAPSGGSTAGKDTGIKGNGGIIPIVVIPSKAGNNPLTDSSKASQRKDNGAEENHLRDRTPLEYDLIREDDAVYKQRLWKVIDAREKMNQVFKNSRVEDNGSQLFFVILFKAVTEGGITAFEDDRFTTPISKERFMRDYSGGLDTSDVPSLDNADVIVRREVRSREFPVDSVYQFMIKEDVIFDKESSRMVTRILGIAPMMPTLIKGKIIEGVGNEAFPKFWIYYPDIRPILAKYIVYNPKNYGASMNWEDLLENRQYSSYIVKSSLNNFRDIMLKNYINDPLFRLLEGEKIKEKIFNYEQGLWSY